MRVVFTLLLLALGLWADNFRLYLSDGTFHMVREYQVLDDRVRYYSIERSDWEELPREMVDLKKTEAERGVRAEEDKKRAVLEDAEEKYEREVAREIARVPQGPGVYFAEGDKVTEVKVAEVKLVSDKKRTILKIMTPVPMIPGKASLELAGEQSAVTIPAARQEFYFRVENMQRFGIVRMRPKKGLRQVAIWQIDPVSKQVFFDMDLVEIFRHQVKDDLYKIWPTRPLTPGEYAVIQYVEGEAQVQVWDFRFAGEATKR